MFCVKVLLIYIYLYSFPHFNCYDLWFENICLGFNLKPISGIAHPQTTLAPTCTFLHSPAPTLYLYLPSPTCTLHRLPAPSIAYLHPPSPTCTFLRLPAPSFAYLHPPSPTCTLLRLPAPSFAYLHPPSPTCTLHRLLAPSFIYLHLPSRHKHKRDKLHQLFTIIYITCVKHTS